MAAPLCATSSSYVCIHGLPPAADDLLRRMLAIVAAFVGPCAISHPVPLLRHSATSHVSGTPLRTPEFSVLGFASLLLGISSTLMLFGSIAFFLGFLLMPLIVPASIAVCFGGLLAMIKESRPPPSSASSPSSLQSGKVLQKKTWFG